MIPQRSAVATWGAVQLHGRSARLHGRFRYREAPDLVGNLTYKDSNADERRRASGSAAKPGAATVMMVICAPQSTKAFIGTLLTTAST
jgi:hypothetical protein